jgi:hypothetical protein
MFNFFGKKKPKEAGEKNYKNMYVPMRNMAFGIKPEQLGINLENDEQVYGSIIDMEAGDGKVATMICFRDGSASLYFSNGGGIIGAGQQDNVRQAVASYLTNIHQVLSIMELTDNYNIIPKEKHHIFYLLTRGGIYSLDISLKDINKSKETNLLFSLSQMVLNEIRKASENREN